MRLSDDTREPELWSTEDGEDLHHDEPDDVIHAYIQEIFDAGFLYPREWCRENGVELRRHLCGCEFCSRSYALCPGTQDSVRFALVEQGWKLGGGEA